MWTDSGKQYLLGRGRNRESPARRVSAVPMVTNGGGVFGSVGTVCRSRWVFALVYDVVTATGLCL